MGTTTKANDQDFIDETDENVVPFPAPSDKPEGYAPEFSEEGIALSFAEKYKNKFRYVKKWGTWLEWTGAYWKKEETALVYDIIRRECRLAAERANNQTSAKRCVTSLSKGATRGAIEIIVRADRRFAATTDQWDTDDWLLNTPGGIIDLRTSENLGHDPRKYCTKITSIAPGGSCPLWLSFLDKITGGDKELQAYLKRKAGYCLTGSTEEQAMFFAHGPGGNGKGVFYNTIGAIMGSYYVTSPAATFAEQKNQRHETELARLCGARLVVSQETERGQFWADTRIKNLTGGDPIPARFMHGDYFEFMPKFKLCIAGNHKPQLRCVDDAIRRRFNLIPFDVTIKEEEKDRQLGRKLRAEYGGILDWMIEGCVEWLEHGLNPPAVVVAATNEYLHNEDKIGLWLSDMCITPDSYSSEEDKFSYNRAEVEKVYSTKTTLASLFASWQKYAEAAHVASGNDKYLKEELLKRTFKGEFKLKSDKSKKGIVITGIRLKRMDELLMDDILSPPDTGCPPHPDIDG